MSHEIFEICLIQKMFCCLPKIQTELGVPFLSGNPPSLTFLYALLLTCFICSLPQKSKKKITFLPFKNSSRSGKGVDLGEKS